MAIYNAMPVQQFQPFQPQMNPGMAPQMPQFNNFQNPYMYGAGPGITPPFRINAMNQPIAGQQTFQQGIQAAQPQQGITPELQQVMDIIRQNQDYAAKTGMSRAQALAVRRGLPGSSIEQFGVQQANEAASRAGQEQMANVLLANVQRQQALQDLQTRGYFERAGQEASLGAQLGTAEGQLTSDEIASLRNIQLANQQMQLQQMLGERGIDAQYANIAMQGDIANRESRNQLIGTGASLLSPLLFGGGGGLGGGGGGGGGLLSGLFGGGGAAGVGGIANTSAGAAGASSSLFPGGLGSVGTAAPAGMARFLPGLGLAGLTVGGVLGYQSLSDKAKSVVAPLVNPIKTVKTVGKSVSKAVKKVFRY